MREWLKKMRDERKLTQEEVAGSLGISQNYYSEIENGRKQADLNLSIVTKLSEVLSVSVEEIIRQENALKGEG